MPKILIVDDEAHIRRIISVMLTEKGYRVAEADSGEHALSLFDEERPDLVLLDVKLPGMDGLATLRALLSRGRPSESLDCIMMTAFGTIPSAVEAMKIGAFDYLTKPFDNDDLMLSIERALNLRRLSREVEELRTELSTRYGFNEIVGISPKLQVVFRTMAKLAAVDATLLIEGESGTGKELVARAIHRRSNRALGPFVAVNCGAIPHSLFEAEFLGHERGAFTDAREARAGRFELANGGILFLDEVGELPLDSQVKLLRILQEREVTRLGGRTVTKLDLRVIAATNSDLKSAVEAGRFRNDLYWRLNVVKIVLPALRERREDINLIIDHFVDQLNRELGLSVRRVSSDARQLLTLHNWPGNVRELENAICSAMIMCEGDEVRVTDLPPRVTGASDVSWGPAGSRIDVGKQPLLEVVREATEKLERMMIVSRLAEMMGNRTATAESLGISRRSLFNKMRQYGLGDGESDEGHSQ